MTVQLRVVNKLPSNDWMLRLFGISFTSKKKAARDTKFSTVGKLGNLSNEDLEKIYALLEKHDED